MSSDPGPVPRPSAPLRLIERVARIGGRPDDPPDLRIRKGTLSLTAISITALASVWVLMYLALGRPLSAAIPLSYQVASILSLWWFARTGRYDTFRVTQVVLMLLLPVLLQWSLGGFENGSAVMLWAFVAPVGALVFGGPRAAVLAFLAFVGLTIVSGFIDPSLAADAEPVPELVRRTMFVLDVVGVAFVTFLVLIYFVRERQAAQDALDVAHRELQVEQDRSEALLANMLPASVASRLKSGERVADAYEQATVLFVDLVDSTPLAGRLSPTRLVELLDRVFSGLDDVAREHGLTKIKTGGDSWMAVAGVPEPRPDHAQIAADVAMHAGEVVAAAAAELGETLKVRVGMHSGPVVAGVIGTRTYAFDIWGQTVAIASRMESYGLPGRVQVSLATAQLLMPTHLLRMRGTLDIKGVGEMAVYLLEGKR